MNNRISSKINRALAEFPERAEQVDKATQRVLWILRAQLALWLGGAVLFVVTTAQMIDYDAPWWAITLGVLITVPWGVGAASMRPRFERVREIREEWAHVRGIVQDDDFKAFVKIFTGPDATRGPAPTSVVVDDAGDAPAPAETPGGTKP